MGTLGGYKSKWESARHLFRDPWEREPPDERPYRIAAFVLSLLLNLIFAIMAIYFMYLQYVAFTTPKEEQLTTQVEFIGRGNTVEGGGDLQPSQLPSTSSASSSSAPPAAAPSPSPAAASSAAAASRPVAQPEPPQPVPPAPTNVVLSEPRPDQSPLQLPRSDIAAPSATPAPVSAPQRELAERQLSDPLASVRIEVPAQGTSPTRDVRIAAPSRTLTERGVPNPSPAPSASASTGASPSPSASAGTSSSASTASGQSATGRSPAAAGSTGTATSTGPRAPTTPGGWYSDRGANDLGNSNRNRDGSRLTGNDLFDEQGKPKLPYSGSASRNDPPGMNNGEIRDLDRAGTWRKRRPTDTGIPGSSMVWLPHEDVLTELVRRGIKEVSIRIPGTTTSVRCKVSLLALGGGCGLTNPNLQDQEATARPSPKFEYKPELNQDNGGRRADQKPEDFGPGAILPGQAIKKQPPTEGPAPVIADPKRPQFKFGGD